MFCSSIFSRVLVAYSRSLPYSDLVGSSSSRSAMIPCSLLSACSAGGHVRLTSSTETKVTRKIPPDLIGLGDRNGPYGKNGLNQAVHGSAIVRRPGCYQKSVAELSNIRCTSRPTGRRDLSNGIARASESPPGDLLTEDSKIAEEDAETCEIVQGSDVTLGEGENTFQGYLIQAIKNNNGVPVLFLADVYGFEDRDTRDFAYRLACFGYNVLVPDLFRGMPWSKAKPKSEYQKWRDLHSPDRVAGDIDVATKYLAEEVGAEGKLVVIGFCFGGGRLIETLARDSSNLFATGAFLYGTKFEISLATQIKVPLLLIAGDSDDLCPTSVVHQLEQEVHGSKAKIYTGRGHAFAHHPKSSEEDEDAEDAFTEIRQWFHDRLLCDTTD